MPTPTALISEHLSQDPADWLAERCGVVRHAHDQPGFRDELARAEALIVRTYTIVNDDLLDAAPRLRVVGRAGVGLDNIDLDACKRRGIEVVYTPDANSQAVVEYVLGLMLDAVRPRADLPAIADDGMYHTMRKQHVGRQLDQMTLGILGLGRIGKRLGKAAHALGMNLRVCDLLPEADLRRDVDYPFAFVPLEQLLADADVITMHVDGRPENRHLLDEQTLGHLCDDALLINAARGMLIDQQALADWAKAHPHARVILDVLDPEPPAPDEPLRTLPNVRILPHLASRTDTAMDNMSWVVHDVWAVLEGREPTYSALPD
ncbi:NAD(P)-dependent oxidoreductase [Mucisphaera calidilacus]|uniref:D-3-phosphoglycerate dehydrogenase n=1 Tax=Mucisphaera calidilacus TaxID=2527982 RepID=A0A518BTP7_9BACT|nr:NAD(P)-dependent oxidoreductase [Mucisphaera calidilacus]QDU70350.1 D-3-phosphoglycerate dehydrogenase [Mucisphaera calidilacus]